ncbi:probable LRR receptor-like serine/threonine-protein kinase At1g06840 isoform X1 [Chenopodium quinoa]|uniref:probable LRR receptor-like serine/threonine-protein kinase At1g06840 isoform X1 n=1 Tax=Chenopodium quinoa TaxID=63459 RepID=UPI000B796423|nr:probable LRR receptor-like serine/threonine-protein kinase At1g06840 isoform X1 [Chenopodium quinoa]
MKWVCQELEMKSIWLLLLAVCLCLSIGVQAQVTDPTEVSALKEIRRNLVDPMKNLSNWDRGDPCSSNWTGIICYNKTLNDGYMHVQELELLNMNLSGSLSPELGNLTYLKILDFMWNKISGSIPKEIGNIKTLELLLVNGNQLTGPLPEELGYLPNLNRIQIDQNKISGELPKSFANLNKTKHFHMNNNSISGQIPHELSRLPALVHFLLDNNNLSGHLPPEFSELPNLLIIQLDNNHFDGTTIPASYSNMSKLLKMSLRNCGLQGEIPDLSKIPQLSYIDLSSNQLSGSIPSNKFSDNMTTIILSNNSLTGNIPVNFSKLPFIERLSLADNKLNGSVPATIWENRTLTNGHKLILDFENNMLSSISGSTNIPPNVTLHLEGNPLCSRANLDRFCGSNQDGIESEIPKIPVSCPSQACPPSYEYPPGHPESCVCAAPLIIEYRLKSPGFLRFGPYQNGFEEYLSSGLRLNLNQLDINSIIWQEGPRLKMSLKLFPDNNSHVFNSSEVRRIWRMFTGWQVPDNDTFGPYELIDFTLLDPYKKDFGMPTSKSGGVSGGALAGIILGTLAFAVTLSAAVSLLIYKIYLRRRPHGGPYSRRRAVSRNPIKMDGVKGFSYEEMAVATNNFSESQQVGQGGYGKVYKGILADGSVVAIKRAQEGSLQGDKEFFTEIELLSRLHHRNLVSLVGYCDEEGEQMLIYEFMPNGTLREHISAKCQQPLNFASRLRVALGSAKGVLYLHTEADPPIFHRDIKATNILLDSKYMAKVADFGLSRLAPVPDIEGLTPTHVSTVVKGTPGYLDPEYFLTHKLTDKSDVYSLGVVFLELLTAMHPISHGKNIVREVNTAFQAGTIFSVIDERMGSYPSECVEKFLNLALRCCQDQTDARPTMMEVVRELENISSLMPEFESSSMPSGSISSPSYSSNMRHPFISSDVSGSDLISGVVPDINPR